MSTLLKLADELERRSKDYQRIHEGMSRTLEEVARSIRIVVPNPEGIRTDTKCLLQEDSCKAGDCPEHGLFQPQPGMRVVSVGETQQEAHVIASYQQQFEEAFKRGLQAAQGAYAPPIGTIYQPQFEKLLKEEDKKGSSEPPKLPGPPGRHTTAMGFFESVSRMNEEARFQEADLAKQELWRLERLEQIIQEGISTLTDVSRVVRYHLDNRTTRK